MERSKKVLCWVIAGFWAGAGGLLAFLYWQNPERFFGKNSPGRTAAPAALSSADAPPIDPPDADNPDINTPNANIPDSGIEEQPEADILPSPSADSTTEQEESVVSFPPETADTAEEEETRQKIAETEHEIERLTTEWETLRKRYPPDNAFYDDLARWETEWNQLAESIVESELIGLDVSSFAALREKIVPFLTEARRRQKEVPLLAESGSFCGDASKWNTYLTKISAETALSDEWLLPAEENRLAFLDDWNRFAEEYGAELNRFAVSSETAQKAVQFYQQFDSAAERLSFQHLPEWSNFSQRLPELAVSARGIPFQERILRLLTPPFDEAYLYEPGQNQRYYLTQPPQTGENSYYADLFGTRGKIILDEAALPQVTPVHLAQIYAPWRTAAESIPDTLRLTDPAEWYRRWTEILRSILTEKIAENGKKEERLLKFFLLNDIAAVLSAGDWHFERRLSVWQAYFSNGRVPQGTDFLQAENPQTALYRRNAAEILTFLPGDILEVDKTTGELNEKTARPAAVYRPIGWLDQDFCGEWMLRFSDAFTDSTQGLSGPLPQRFWGDWVLFIPQEDGLAEPLCAGTVRGTVPAVRLSHDQFRRGMLLYWRQVP